MAEERAQRRLAAILAADVAGYSRLMGEDEEGTLDALTAHLAELIGPLIAEHHGRIVKTTGDGLLAEFASVVDAVCCAIAIQNGMRVRNADTRAERRLEFRIGINLGDVIVRSDDVFGDGVNVAARLESLAEPGGICLSRAARDQIRDKLDYRLDDMGEVEVKNIARPVRAFRVTGDGAGAGPAAARGKIPWRSRRLAFAGVLALVLAGGGLAIWFQPWRGAPGVGPGISLSAGTSIAVLPFANLSGKPEHEYFSDGITNDLITDLSKFQDLFVIASNSAFTYKGRPVKVQEIGRELGVRYVLEGSVQKQGERVRINAQLVDAANGRHLWAERYEESIADIFALQDRIRKRIVSTLAVKLTRFEQQRAFAKPTRDLKAYDYVLRGRKLLAISRREENFEAQEMFRLAIERDPDYGAAYAGLGRSLYETVLFGWTPNVQATLDRVRELALKAIADERSSAEGHSLLASLLLTRHKHDAALIEIERAIALNPNSANLHAIQGVILVWSGHAKGAILAMETALRFDPLMGPRPLSHLGMAYYLTERYGNAERVLERAVHLNPDFAYGQTLLAATYARLEKPEAARRAARAVKRLDPFFSADRFGHQFRDPADAAAVVVGLRRAGL